MYELNITFLKDRFHILGMFLTYLNGKLPEEQIKEIDINISCNMLAGWYNLHIVSKNGLYVNKIQIFHHEFIMLLRQLNIY